MRHQRFLAAAAALLLCAGATTARAEHFQYRVDLSGSYSIGGAEGCAPPGFDQPACPRSGTLTGMLSFDTPGAGDGSFEFDGTTGDIRNFAITVGWLPGDYLVGAVNVNGGVPSGIAQSSDNAETFLFDWSNRSASYDYDYLDHGPYGNFAGTLTAVPEPAPSLAMLGALAGLAALARRRRSVS